MVLSRRADGSDADVSNTRFDGTTNVTKFFFVYELAVMKTATEEEKATQLLCYLDGMAFDFYYEMFAKDGSLIDEAKNYSAVKAAFFERFKEEEKPDDVIRRAMAARLDSKDLLSSLRNMDRLFDKAGFNDSAKFGLLRNATMEHLDLAQFAIYRGVTDYIGLQKAVKDFWSGRQAFQSSAVYADSVAGSLYDRSRDLGIVPAKKLMLRPDSRVANVESKVDALADQLSQLSLLIKKQASPQAGPAAEKTKLCSFCKKEGHGANRCPTNPHRDTICPRCGKKGHAESTCWAKVAADSNRRVGFRGPRSESAAELRLVAGSSQSNNGNQTHPASDHVTVVAETEYLDSDEEVVAAAKRNAEGQALPKQARTGSVPVRSLLNPSLPEQMQMPVPIERHTVRPITTRSRARKTRAKKNSRKTGIAELVGKYHMLAELARAPCGLTFGQLMRGDADEAKREIRRLFSSRVSRSVLAQVGGPPRRLKVVSVRVYGTVTQALLDSGAVPNLMSARLCDILSLTPEATTRRITVADGTSTIVRGIVYRVPVSFGGLTEPLDFLVVEGTPFDVIIGCPALEKLQACLNLGQQHVTITVNGDTVQLGFEYDTSHYRLLHSGTDSEDFTSEDGDEVTPEENNSDEDEYVVAILDDPPFEPDLQADEASGVQAERERSWLEGRGDASRLSSLAKTVNVLFSSYTDLSSDDDDEQVPRNEMDPDGAYTNVPDLIDVESLFDSSDTEDMPDLIDLETDSYAFVSRADVSFHSLSEAVADAAHSVPHQGKVDVLSAVPDASAEDTEENPFEVYPGNDVGPTPGNEAAQVGESTPPPTSSSEELEEDKYAATLAAKLRHLPEEAQNTISSALRDSGAVAWSLDEIRPADVPVTHRFELTDDTPIHLRVRRLPPRHNTVVKEELDKMLEAGIITPSKSAWSFPVVIATKKDGKPRFCVDYRTLNRRMKADRWPLPKIEEIFDDLQGSSVFTNLDLFSGYWQVRMEESCKEKTSFVCRFGTFQFEVMPFGLMNAPSTFQRMMDLLTRDLDFVRVYVDDVVVHSVDMTSHLNHLLSVFRVISRHGLKVKVSKCSFAQSRVRLLGHVVDATGVSVDPHKVQSIREAPRPTSKTELRSFLGLAGYYRRFIRGFAELSADLHAGTSVKTGFKWTPDMEAAFKELKSRITSPPVLAFPDFNDPFIVETDASSSALGAVLAQRKEDGKVHPVQYASRTMTTAERNYSACEREALAVIFALKKYRVYLLSSKPFTIYTDHQALQYAFLKKDVHGRLARWLDLLAEYDFTIRYRPGMENGAADYLSRVPDTRSVTESSEACRDSVTCLHEASAPQGRWELQCTTQEELFSSALQGLEGLEPHLMETGRYLLGFNLVEQDKKRQRAIRRGAKKFMLWNEKLFRRTAKGLRSIPLPSQRAGVLKLFHDDVGHWDVDTTKQFVTSRFWWPTVYRDVYDYVKSCDGCQRATAIPRYKTDMRVPITGLFDVFSVDFAGPFPRSTNGNRFVLVGVEHLTGWPLAIPTKNATAEVVIAFMEREVIYQFGPPQVVVSDNATCFTAKALEEYMSSMAIDWKTVLAYAPMSNGRAERMVGTLKKGVLKTVLTSGTEWDEAIWKVVYGYRRRRLSGGYSPFELLYGTPPRMLSSDPCPLVLGAGDVERSAELLALQAFRANRVTGTTTADGSQGKKFDIGDEVLVARGTALNQTAKWPAFKSKFYGPCRVVSVKHPRYELISLSGRITRNAVHARRLIPYRRRSILLTPNL